VDLVRRAFALQAGFEWRNRDKLGISNLSGQGFSMQSAPAELLAEVKQSLSMLRRLV